MLEFTGERVIPGQVNTDLWNEHFSRYAWASRFAAGRRVLDAGCGTGYGSAEIAATAASVVGIDIDPQAVQWAAREYPNARCRWAAGSCAGLPFRDGIFDLVVSFEVIEHLPDQGRFLRECSRVLTFGGLLLVSTPNKTYYTDSRGEAGENPWHIRELDLAEFETELRSVFPHIAVVVQNRCECFGIYRPGEVGAAVGRVDGSEAAVEDAHFFIGMCSRTELPPPESFIYVPRAANLLRERELHISKLDNWLTAVRDRLQAAEGRIVELQDELAAEQQTARRQIDELEAENRSRTEWAQSIQADLERTIEELKQCGDLLTAAETTVVERSAWAQRLDTQLRETERQLAAVAASRWHRVGRKLRVGPVIPLLEKPAG
ncbi:MAG TPA: methyltransferase domain-containing protein [Bryobacteraceae bacterium]|nr:methyltransferase domain-containing protein [Bryobacteraceae bacterium]